MIISYPNAMVMCLQSVADGPGALFIGGLEFLSFRFPGDMILQESLAKINVYCISKKSILLLLLDYSGVVLSER